MDTSDLPSTSFQNNNYDAASNSKLQPIQTGDIPREFTSLAAI